MLVIYYKFKIYSSIHLGKKIEKQKNTHWLIINQQLVKITKNLEMNLWYFIIVLFQ